MEEVGSVRPTSIVQNDFRDSTPISALTKMRVEPWKKWLEKGFASVQPQQAAQILDGIVNGIPVDFIGDRDQPVHGQNRKVSPEIAAKVTKVIEEDVKNLKKAGPFDEPPFKNLFISPIGAVPKKNSEKVRVIHNLSFPFYGDSVNTGIREVKMSIDSFDKAVEAVVELGRGCLLIKLDVEAAYKQIAVRPEDWHLLGFKWLDKYYYERVLPFGLRSSCRLWDVFAAALHYMFERHLGIEVVIHYVDDFLFVVSLSHEDAESKLKLALELCEELGIPMAGDKTEGPTTSLIFLGLILDTLLMRASLPQQKLEELKQLAKVWMDKKSASINELQSLTGVLGFATKVIRPGRHFLRRIITQTSVMLKKLKDPRSYKRHTIPAAVKADIAWWLSVAEQWNGVSLLYEQEWTESTHLLLTTDACKKGYGAVYGNQWFAGEWSEEISLRAKRSKMISMPFLELYALVQAAATFANDGGWAGKRIIFKTDCEVNVKNFLSGQSKDPDSMALLRCLFGIAAKCGFDFRIEHVAGVANTLADILSRDGDCVSFRQAHTSANSSPTPIVLITLE